MGAARPFDRGARLFGSCSGHVEGRKLPSTEAIEAAEPRLPLRVLLVLARPEEPGVSFLDPRASALPLATAIEDLGDDVALTVLAEGTVKALREALDAGEREERPFQVVHFDGHGVYDKKTGLGRLCGGRSQGLARTGRTGWAPTSSGSACAITASPLRPGASCRAPMPSTEPPTTVIVEPLLARIRTSVVAMSFAVSSSRGGASSGAF